MDEIPFAPLTETAPEVPTEGELPLGVLSDTGQGVTAPLPTAEQASQRALKYSFALGTKTPGSEAIAARIQSGLEESDRQKYTAEKQAEIAQAKTSLVKDMLTTASTNGTSLSAMEAATILELSGTDMNKMNADPKTFFEREYARKVISNTVDTGEETPFTDALTGEGDKAYQKLDAFEEVVTSKEGAQKIAEDIDNIAGAQSWLGYVADSAKSLVPGYTWYKLHNILSQEKGGSFLAGNNLAEQVDAFYSMSAEQGLPLLKQTVDELAKDNPQLAQMFAHAAVNYPSSSRLLDNVLISGVDIASVLPFGVVARSLKAPLKEAGLLLDGTIKATDYARDAGARFSKVLTDIAKEVTKPKTTPQAVADAAGKIEVSASMNVVDKARAISQQGSMGDRTWDDLAGELFGLTNPAEQINRGPRSYHSTGFLNQMIEKLTDHRDNIIKNLFLDPLKTDRFGPEAVARATKIAEEVFRVERREIENDIMNVTTAPVQGRLGQHEALITMGDGAKLFENEGNARWYAALNGIEKYDVAPVGKGWQLEVRRPLDFTSPEVLEGMKIDAKNAPTPMPNMIGKFVSRYRTGDEVMPKDLVEKFKRVVYGASGVEQLVREIAKDVGKIKDNRDFLKFLEYQQNAPNPRNPDARGMFSHTIGEFEVQWASKINRLPTEAETQAYFHYKLINDFQYMGLNLGLYLDKNAVGLTLNAIDDLPIKLEGKISSFDAFNKTKHGKNARVLLLENGKEPRVFNSKRNEVVDESVLFEDQEKLHAYAEKLTTEKGYIVTQLSPTGQQDLRAFEGFKDVPHFAKQNVEFVISKRSRAEPLNLKQLPYQEGGHNIMPDGWYISQPKLSVAGTRTIYGGDFNVHFAANEKIAKQIAGNYEKARGIYNEMTAAVKANDPVTVGAKRRELADFASKNLPVSGKTLMKAFSKRGDLNPENPILARASNQSLDDAHQLSAVRGTQSYERAADSEYNLYRGRVNLDFAMKREGRISEVIEKGSPHAPLFGQRPANFIDPLKAMDRSLYTLTKGRHFDPLKLETATRFVAEFGDLLKPTAREVDANPFVALQRGDFKDNLHGLDLDRLSQAQAYRSRALSFMSLTQTPTERYYSYLGQKLLAGNPDAQSSFRKSLAEILVEKDPVNMIKGLTYHVKMGFFNPVVLLQQANTFTHVVGLAGPVQGTKAAVAAMVQHIILANPDALMPRGMKIIERLGFNPEEFRLATEELRRTSFHKMGMEYASREQNMTGRALPTRFGAMMDFGQIPMKMGEQFIRRAAWNAAYFEALAKKGGKRLTDNELQTVLNRADMMNVNMSHASRAVWQEGVQGLPTQFWGYQARLMEQFTGKRLTRAEKARLFATYSTVYGIPVGLTAATGVWPVHKTIKESLIANNINTDDNLLVKTINDGLLSTMVQLVGGQDTNVEEVYGPAGISVLKDLMDGQKNMAEVIGGASGSTMFGIAADLVPAIGWIKAAIDPGQEALPVTAQDFLDVLDNVSAFKNLVHKPAIALAGLGYLTQHSRVIDNGDSSLRQLVNGLFNMQPQEVSDMYSKIKVNKAYADDIKTIADSAKEDIRMMLRTENYEDKLFYLKRSQIKSALIADPLRRNALIAETLSENRTLLEEAARTHAKRSQEAREFEFDKMMARTKQKAQ